MKLDCKFAIDLVLAQYSFVWVYMNRYPNFCCNLRDIYKVLTKSKLFKSKDKFENSKIEIGIRSK
jgi:hypothetical protein